MTTRTVAVILLLAAAAPAAEKDAPPPARTGAAPVAATEDAQPRETILSLIVKGRWIMVPLGICSMIVVALAIERAISLRKKRVGSPDVLDRIFDELPARSRATREQVARAIAISNESQSIVGRVLRAGLEKIHRDESHAMEALEEAGAREMHLLRRKVRPLSVISALGPLLGLLGTISGMITCFEKATAADTSSRVGTLTQGIYEALVATATGLLVAIVSLILYHYFLGKVDSIGDRIDETASRLVDHYYGVPLTVKPRAAHPHAEHPVESGSAHGAAQEGASLIETGG